MFPEGSTDKPRILLSVVPPVPAIVVTDPVEIEIFRMSLLPLSPTIMLPDGSRVIAVGPLNLATLLRPSTFPPTPVPARVDTEPVLVILRTMFPPD